MLDVGSGAQVLRQPFYFDSVCQQNEVVGAKKFSTLMFIIPFKQYSTKDSKMRLEDLIDQE